MNNSPKRGEIARWCAKIAGTVQKHAHISWRYLGLAFVKKHASIR